MMQICTECIQNKCHDHHLLKKVVKLSCSKIDYDLEYQGQFFFVASYSTNYKDQTCYTNHRLELNCSLGK